MLYLIVAERLRSHVCQTDGGFVSIPHLNRVAVDAECICPSGMPLSGWMDVQG